MEIYLILFSYFFFPIPKWLHAYPYHRRVSTVLNAKRLLVWQQPSDGMQYSTSPKWKQNPLIITESVSFLIRAEDILAAMLLFLWFVVLFIMKTNWPSIGGYWARFADVSEDTLQLKWGCYDPCRTSGGLESLTMLISQMEWNFLLHLSTFTRAFALVKVDKCKGKNSIFSASTAFGTWPTPC